jgi:uncharacterized membrane protein YiaA
MLNSILVFTICILNYYKRLGERSLYFAVINTCIRQQFRLFDIENVLEELDDMYHWKIIINTCAICFLLFLCYCSFNNLSINYAVIIFSICFAILSISSTFKEFDDCRIFISHLPMHIYHLFIILYGFFFVRNALYLKYFPIE